MGAVDTTYTFTATDTITSTKMNNIIDQTTMTSDAIIGNTLEVASGKLKVRAQGITSNEMATGSVSSDAIANGSVTSTKTDSNGPKWGSIYTDVGSGTASDPYYFSITPNRTGNGTSVLQFGSTVGNNSNAYLYRSSGTNGQFSIVNNGTGAITFSSSGGVTFGSANMPTPSGTAPVYGVRAWVNFNGVGTTGANMTIRGQGNVSSVNKLGTGRYRVTFTTPMQDANYATIAGSDANSPHKIAGVIAQDASYVDIAYSQINTSTARDDADWGQVTIIR